MASIENIKKKINTINNIKKITNAMKLVSSVNLRKIRKNFNNISPFYHEFYYFMSIVLEDESLSFDMPKDKPTLWVIFTSSLGLCGGFNNQIINELQINLKPEDKIIVFGKKGYSILKTKKLNHQVIYYISKNPKHITYNLCDNVSKIILVLLKNGLFSNLKIIYTKFVNSLNMYPKIFNVFPIDKSLFSNQNNKKNFKYIFEPKVEKMFKKFIGIFFSTCLYGSAIESSTSENASRKNSMETATNNADDLNKKYLLEYSSKRQAKITQEINEIIGGTNASK